MKRNNAEVREIELDRKNREIVVRITSKNTLYIEEGQYGMMLLNSAPLVEGFNYVLEHGHEAVEAMKGNKEFKTLTKENQKLREKLATIFAFENGEKVKVEGYTYQKAINEDSFYKAIGTSIGK